MYKKLICELNELDDVLKDGCLLFGAGKVAKAVVKYAAKKKDILAGILVSDTAANPSDVMGIEVSLIKSDTNKNLIICTMELLHENILEDIEQYNFKNVYLVSDILYGKICYCMGDYELEQIEFNKRMEKRMNEAKEGLLKFVPRPCLEYLVVNILDHCNLKCKGCDHFACIADPYFVSFDTIRRDIQRMSQLFEGDYITKIAVMGGEPLLHPELNDILIEVRKCFPHAVIRLTTNALLLLKQDDDFWKVCRDNRITIVNTKYPINLDYEKIREKARDEEVQFHYFERTGDHLLKQSTKKYINLKGDSNPVKSFAECNVANYGNFLMEGKLYGCPFSCQSYRIFNKKFDKNLRMTYEDYLDIYKVSNKREILEFAAKPKYYCRYCNGISEPFEWSTTNGDISEWV